jgi:hypothetical protein
MRYHGTRPLLRRMQAIDQALRAQKWPTDKTLATHLEVDPRTIRRDLEYMRDEHHAPIAFDRARRGYYYADPTFRLPLVQMSQGEMRPSYAAYEMQLLDDAGSPPSLHGIGSLCRYKSPTANPARPAPEWNTIEVECAGPRITVRVNRQKVLEADVCELADVNTRSDGVPAPKNEPRRGYVALQSRSGRAEFRKAQIRE